ncbi:hypothetical protein C8A01DRAFT_18499 [Parachaetomium inaequale]|uniref:DUF7136 domain-containing protein n=1 Tax=Parachaetomium inaequale TaxID=2588326 RepID=A0AAN6PE70_9PEZI|nr:hypothetical protein C8A01DRAFT_18499 [Parachaetomium inaequale]
MARFTTFLLAVSCALSAAAAADVTLPAMVEVDIIFPRNETYAPTPVFPLVFAIQNLAAASSIGPLDISWAIWKPGSDQPIQFGGNQTVDKTNSTDLHYINLWTAGLGGAESAGTYQLWWRVYYYACLGKKDNPGGISGSRGDNFTFTLDPGAQQPNLSADLDACPAQNATIVITETWPVNASPDRDVCGVVLNAHIDANPCAVNLDSAAASSIAAEVTASACAASPPALTSGCPPPSETKDSSGSRVPVWSGLGMFTGPLLAGLLLLVLQ